MNPERRAERAKRDAGNEDRLRKRSLTYLYSGLGFISVGAVSMPFLDEELLFVDGGVTVVVASVLVALAGRAESRANRAEGFQANMEDVQEMIGPAADEDMGLLGVFDAFNEKNRGKPLPESDPTEDSE